MGGTEPEAAEAAAAAGAPDVGEPKGGASVLHVSWQLWPILLGNVMEWYEFSIYAYMAPQIKANFFPGSTYGVWLGFSLTFLSRPLGGVALGWIGDHLGRRVALSTSIVGMLVATVCQGLLPSYHSGSSTLGSLGFVALLLLRVGQGLSAGGEVGSITSYLFETAPLDKIGRVVMLMPLTANIAYILSSASVEAMLSLTTEDQMLSWGWRVPFILALPPGLLTIWGRRSIPETELFLRELQHSAGSAADAEAELAAPELKESARPGILMLGRAVHDVVRSHGPSITVAVGYLAGPALGLYVATMWIISYLQERGLTPSMSLFMSTFGRFLGVLVQFLCGWLIDKQGIGWVTVCGLLCFALLGLPVFALLDAHGDNGLVAVLGVSICYSVVTNIQCTQMFCAELFPTRVRTLALGLSWNIALCLFGGFGSLLAEAALKVSPLGPGWLISGCATLSLASVLSAVKLERHGVLRLAHRRAAPYWGQAEVQGAEASDGTPDAALPGFPGAHRRSGKQLKGYMPHHDVVDRPAGETETAAGEAGFT